MLHAPWCESRDGRYLGAGLNHHDEQAVLVAVEMALAEVCRHKDPCSERSCSRLIDRKTTGGPNNRHARRPLFLNHDQKANVEPFKSTRLRTLKGWMARHAMHDPCQRRVILNASAQPQNVWHGAGC